MLRSFVLDNTIPHTEILAVPVCCLSLRKTIELAVDLISAGRKTMFTTVNTYSIVVAQNHSEYLKHFKQADVVLPDGMGVVLAVRSLGRECPERVAGPEFVDALLPMAEDKKFSIFFLGSTEENLQKIEHNLRLEHPAIRIAGHYSPPHVSLSEFDDDRIVERINLASPDILLVGMTAPKQELWLSRNYDKVNATFMIGVGAAFDYLAGVKTQCPKIIGRLGLEWLHRLVHSPRHVWKRELTIPMFVYLFMTKQWLTRKSLARR